MDQWLYPEDTNPLDYEGFVYLITNTQSGRMYVGRKYTFVQKKTRIVGESNWRTYYGSSDELKADIKKLGKDAFKREILHFCRTRGETNFKEVEEQFNRKVLHALLPNGERAYYNGNIMSRYFARTPESYAAVSENMSAAIKRYFANNPGAHPMQGKTHPNKGKKIASGHFKGRGKRWCNNGTDNVLLPVGADIPEGFVPGLLMKPGRTSSARRAYEMKPDLCVCGNAKTFRRRKLRFCSDRCKYEAQSIRMSGQCLPVDPVEHGLRRRQRTAERYGFASYEEMRQRAIGLRKTGMSLKRTADAIGCSTTLIQSLTKDTL